MAATTQVYPPLPSSVVNGVKGWNQRHIYNYYGGTGTLDYVIETGGDYTLNLFDIIDQFGTKGVPSPYKGSYIFDPLYFKTGKSLRIKGRFLLGTDTSPVLRMYVRLQNITELITTSLAYTSAIPAKDSISNTPLDFEIITTARAVTRQSDFFPSTNDLYMQANGSCTYLNNSTVYTYEPIYNPNTQYPIVANDTLANAQTALWLDFEDSINITSLVLLYLTIEELE